MPFFRPSTTDVVANAVTAQTMTICVFTLNKMPRRPLWQSSPLHPALLASPSPSHPESPASAALPRLITGAVTKEEAARFFQSFGKLNAEAMFNEVDVDADGGITRREWEGFWRNVR